MSFCKFCCVLPHLSHVMRNSVFGIFGRVRHKLVCSATETTYSWNFRLSKYRYQATNNRLDMHCFVSIWHLNRFSHDMALSSHSTTKPTKWPVWPAKTQISLGIHPVWSVFAECMKKPWVLSYPLSAQQRHWSDWVDAGRAVHIVGFFMTWLNYKLYWSIAHNLSYDWLSLLMSHDWLSHDFHSFLLYCPKEETPTNVWNCWNDPQCYTVNKSLKFRLLKKWLLS